MLRQFTSWWRSLRQGPARVAASQTCEKCGVPAAVYEYRPRPDEPALERRFCGQCAPNSLSLPTPAHQGKVEPPASQGAEIEVQVERLLMFPGANEQLLVLREAGGPRRLSVIIGYHEATALWWVLRWEPCSRPLTHHAWVDTVTALAGSIESACVIARREGTYFAELRLLRDGQLVTIDVRLSDALLVALRAGAPFLFTDSLWATDGVSEPEPA